MAKLAVLSLLCVVPNIVAFVHPGLLATDRDIARARSKIAAGQDPWQSSWEKLTSIDLSKSSYTSNAIATVSRAVNGAALWHDAAAALNLAIRWKISGNDTYADTSAKILTSWADKLQALSGGGDDNYLTAGLQGYQLANAAELLRDYAPFANDGLNTFTSMMTRIFLRMNLAFLKHELPSEHNVKHFFANWELCNVASAMAIGVLTDNQTLWDWTIDYFKSGSGNGAINNAITNIVKEQGTGKSLGQGQESGRDQGHSALDFQLLAAIGQQAWNQGEDLFAYNGSRILLGAEYFARYNLGHDVPFEPYTNGIVSFDKISSASRGAIRPTWELLYAHYAQIKGLQAPWTAAYLNNTLEYFGGFEGGAGSWGEGSGHYDGLGWGSLLYHLDEADVRSLAETGSRNGLRTTSSSPSQASSTALRSVTTSSVIVPCDGNSNCAGASSGGVPFTLATAVASTVLSVEYAKSTAVYSKASSTPVVDKTAILATGVKFQAPSKSPIGTHHHHHFHQNDAVKACPAVKRAS